MWIRVHTKSTFIFIWNPPHIPRKIAQKPPNFETHPKPDTIEPQTHHVPQGITNNGGSDHKTNKQDEYVDFNVSELNEKRSPDQFNWNRRAMNFTKVSYLLDQPLPWTSQQRVKKVIQLEDSEEFLRKDQMRAEANKSEAIVIGGPNQQLRSINKIQDPQNIQNSQSTIGNPFKTTHKVIEKNTPRSEHNLINLLQKVKAPVSKIALLRT